MIIPKNCRVPVSNSNFKKSEETIYGESVIPPDVEIDVVKPETDVELSQLHNINLDGKQIFVESS